MANEQPAGNASTDQELLCLCRAQVRPSWLRKAKGKLPGGEQPISSHMRIMGEPTRGPSTLGNCPKQTVPHGTSHLPSAAGHELLVVAPPKIIYPILLFLFTLSTTIKDTLADRASWLCKIQSWWKSFCESFFLI